MSTSIHEVCTGPFEKIGKQNVKIKHIPVVLSWRSGRNCGQQSWKNRVDQVPAWITPPRKVLGYSKAGKRGGTEKNICRDLASNSRVGGDTTGKLPESGILRKVEAESAHSPSAANPISRAERKPSPPPLNTFKPRFERFLGHFWGKSQRSYASVVKSKRAPVVIVNMQPRGMGRRGSMRGSGRGFGRDHVWRRVDDGVMQNQREEKDVAEPNKLTEGNTVNQGVSSPWEIHATKFEEKTEGSWKGAPTPVEDGVLREAQAKKELCATQVEDQSFFYIEEKVDNRVIKEKSSTAIITIVQGNVGEKQIELEFMNMLGKNLWRWSARSIGDNKFVMRFPDPKMIGDLGYFRPLGMRTAKAQITIDPWSPAVNAKGSLQKGWFRISGIPMEQRSLVTIAKVGGLVGKVVEVDEKTRLRNEYVRARIACRDVTAVPGVVESAIGMFLYDFFFEREILMEDEEGNAEIEVKVDESYQKDAKRFKYEGKFPKGKRQDTGLFDEGNMNVDKGKSKGKENEESALKAGKNYFSCADDEKDKVHITDSDEDDDSDLLGDDLLNMKTGGIGSSSHSDWNTQLKCVNTMNTSVGQHSRKTQCSVIIEELDSNDKKEGNSDEMIFDSTQGSVILNNSQEDEYITKNQWIKADDMDQNDVQPKKIPSPIPARRVSERLKKDQGLRIEEKNRRMAVKRNLEGNKSKPNSEISCLSSTEIIDISKKMGVDMGNTNMESIDLIKEMELARQCLGLLWNCRGIRKKGVAPFIRNLIGLHKFKFIGLQETMVVEGDDSITKKLDPSNDYLWLWSPSNGKSGGILVGSRIDDLDVGSFKQGKHVLQVNYWDKSALCKWNLMVVYGPAHEENKDNFLDELETFCVNSKEPYIVGLSKRELQDLLHDGAKLLLKAANAKINPQTPSEDGGH
ncbi:hypothetical protein Zm00014a_041421 [Zea mays]|uniref:Uncharacterized protein n=1 Tax=Zea mays TaxID=4577 RepID=A0A3L6FTS6_MAIZE|nr:hypothetical protein Zm00014a_041421 [Zea mays]